MVHLGLKCIGCIASYGHSLFDIGSVRVEGGLGGLSPLSPLLI